MDNKTLAVISYITIVGWLVAFILDKDRTDSFRKYHLKQSLGLALGSMLLFLVLDVFHSLIIGSGLLYNLVYGLSIIGAVLGMLAAWKNEKKPLPFIGKYFEKAFSFLN